MACINYQLELLEKLQKRLKEVFELRHQKWPGYKPT